MITATTRLNRIKGCYFNLWIELQDDFLSLTAYRKQLEDQLGQRIGTKFDADFMQIFVPCNNDHADWIEEIERMYDQIVTKYTGRIWVQSSTIKDCEAITLRKLSCI